MLSTLGCCGSIALEMLWVTVLFVPASVLPGLTRLVPMQSEVVVCGACGLVQQLLIWSGMVFSRVWIYRESSTRH